MFVDSLPDAELHGSVPLGTRTETLTTVGCSLDCMIDHIIKIV